MSRRLVGRGEDAIKSYNAQAPTTKNYLSQTVIGAEDEKPCSTIRSPVH